MPFDHRNPDGTTVRVKTFEDTSTETEWEGVIAGLQPAEGNPVPWPGDALHGGRVQDYELRSLLREVLVELRAISFTLSVGLNTKDDPGALRAAMRREL